MEWLLASAVISSVNLWNLSFVQYQRKMAFFPSKRVRIERARAPINNDGKLYALRVAKGGTQKANVLFADVSGACVRDDVG